MDEVRRVIGLLLVIIAASIAYAAAPVLAPPDQPIAIAPVPGFNLKIIDRPAAQVLVVKPDPPVHNWFAGKFIHLPVGQPVEIRINMNGCDTGGNVANTGKWAGLCPVYTYADPEQYATYEWFRRDAKRGWLSGDLFKQGDARRAGTGNTPVQTAIPATLAAEFLSAEGDFWSPWGEIDGGKADPAMRTFTITVTPAAPEMTLAMHLPYLMAYERALIARVKAARFPGVYVDELGHSAAGNPLYMIRVDDPADPAPVQITPVAKPALYPVQSYVGQVLMTDQYPQVHLAERAWGTKRLMFLDAREHPSEQIGSWAVLGALRALVADTPEARRLRQHTTWLLLPVFDPDGVDAAQFNLRTDLGQLYQTVGRAEYLSTPESLAYLSYLRAFANAGWLFAVSASFYSLECNEAAPVCCPFALSADMANVVRANHYWFARVKAMGIPAGSDNPWEGGILTGRLSADCANHYCALTLLFEINDRFPGHRLTLEGLQWLGEDYVAAITDWTALPEGEAVLAGLRANQQERRVNIESESYAEQHFPLEKPTLYEMVMRGY